MKCPRCGGTSESTKKMWKYGKFDTEQYLCNKCNKKFNVYYLGKKLSHTIP